MTETKITTVLHFSSLLILILKQEKKIIMFNYITSEWVSNIIILKTTFILNILRKIFNFECMQKYANICNIQLVLNCIFVFYTTVLLYNWLMFCIQIFWKIFIIKIYVWYKWCMIYMYIYRFKNPKNRNLNIIDSS